MSRKSVLFALAALVALYFAVRPAAANEAANAPKADVSVVVVQTVAPAPCVAVETCCEPVVYKHKRRCARKMVAKRCCPPPCPAPCPPPCVKVEPCCPAPCVAAVCCEPCCFERVCVMVRGCFGKYRWVEGWKRCGDMGVPVSGPCCQADGGWACVTVYVKGLCRYREVDGLMKVCDIVVVE